MPMLVKSDCPVIAAVNQTRKYSLFGIKKPHSYFCHWLHNRPNFSPGGWGNNIYTRLWCSIGRTSSFLWSSNNNSCDAFYHVWALKRTTIRNPYWSTQCSMGIQHGRFCNIILVAWIAWVVLSHLSCIFGNKGSIEPLIWWSNSHKT